MQQPADLPPYIVPHSRESIPVIYHDQDILVVEKPHLLLSVPGRHPVNRDSLIGRLSSRYPGVAAVHRLDLDTSGLLVVPRHRRALSALSRAFQQRRVSKAYRAIVAGIPAASSGEIDLPIARDWHNRPRQKICHKTGKPSLTRWRLIGRGQSESLLELYPITGRSHQLRIHLRELGHPILGCDMYAPPDVLAKSPRLLLHATQLGFEHPRSGEWLQAASPAPFGIDSAGLVRLTPN